MAPDDDHSYCSLAPCIAVSVSPHDDDDDDADGRRLWGGNLVA